MDSVSADLQYNLWYCAILNTFCVDIAFKIETHDKNFKKWKIDTQH